jgi:hypothetical protein
MAVIKVYEVLGEDTHGAATIGNIRFDIRPDNKAILSIDNEYGDTLASAILSINNMNELVNLTNDMLLLQLRNKK